MFEEKTISVFKLIFVHYLAHLSVLLSLWMKIINGFNKVRGSILSVSRINKPELIFFNEEEKQNRIFGLTQRSLWFYKVLEKYIGRLQLQQATISECHLFHIFDRMSPENSSVSQYRRLLKLWQTSCLL